MKTLRRYLMREVFWSILTVLSALLILYIMIVDVLQDFSNAGVTRNLTQILLISLLAIPSHIYELLPIATLLGSLFALAQLAANSEYTVMRTSGASLKQICRALLTLGFILAVFSFLLAEFVVPQTDRLAERIKATTQQGQQVQRFQSGFWFREDNRFINISDVLADARLSGFKVYQFNKDQQLEQIVRAQYAKHLTLTNWTLQNVSITRFSDNKISTEKHAELAWQTVLTPNMLSVLQLQPDRLSVASLVEYLQHLTRNKQRADRFEAALWSKFLYPLACMILIVMALPFAQASSRSGGVGLRLFLGIMLGLGFVLLNRLFTYAGSLYGWPPSLSAIAPYFIFASITVVLLWRNERR
jgi:lipopolysaccharide export system permease protein